MKVAIGTTELDDNILKSIRREKGMFGKATREEAKAWAIAALQQAEAQTIADYPPSSRPSKEVSVTY